ncbi:MAG: 16S rRNA (guanine(527)-N(7))-methyltransferase RsmG [Halofilum sp. (in: g-proteobacteria)]
MSTDVLSAGAEALGVPLEKSARDRLLIYRDELARWNRVHNLTAVRDPELMVPVHLLDSLALVPLVRGPRVADLGSGGGLPGLPLAIVRPQWRVTLIEPRAKRAAFLAHVVRRLALDNVIVARTRGEDLLADPAGDDRFDTIACRAFGTLAEFIAAAGRLCSPGGCLLAAKGRDPGGELAQIGAGWRGEIWPLRVPGVDAERHVVRLEPVRPDDE